MTTNASVTEFMSRDHDRLDALFQDYQLLRKKDPKAAAGTFARFAEGLRRHIVWEEELLFPVFERRTGMTDAGPTAVMRLEHREIQEKLEEIRSGLEHGRDTVRHEERLLEVLTDHNGKEEMILYPWMDSSATPSEREDVLARMRSAA